MKEASCLAGVHYVDEVMTFRHYDKQVTHATLRLMSRYMEISVND